MTRGPIRLSIIAPVTTYDGGRNRNPAGRYSAVSTTLTEEKVRCWATIPENFFQEYLEDTVALERQQSVK